MNTTHYPTKRPYKGLRLTHGAGQIELVSIVGNEEVEHVLTAEEALRLAEDLRKRAEETLGRKTIPWGVTEHTTGLLKAIDEARQKESP